MEIRFSEFDIRDLLSKTTVFEPTIGNYQFFTVNEQFLYVVKLSNGTIYFTTDELLANKEQRISREQLILAAGRFTKTASQSGPQRRRESVIPDEYADALGTSVPKKNQSKMVILGAAVVLALGMVGAMVFLMSAPETETPTYIEKVPNPADTSGQAGRD
ncbi:hypothetical protein D3C87_200780 [compost metagenome]